MAIHVLSRRKQNNLNNSANLLKRFADVRLNVTKDLEDRSQFSNLTLSLKTAQAIISLPPAIKFQSIHNKNSSFYYQQILKSKIPEIDKILTEYAQLSSEYTRFENNASLQTDLLAAQQQKISAIKERPITKKLLEDYSSIRLPFTLTFSAISGYIVSGDSRNWLRYLTLVTIPLGFLFDIARHLYRQMFIPVDKQIAGVGSFEEFETKYLGLSSRLKKLKTDASELQHNLMETDLDSILLTILKDTPMLDPQTYVLLETIVNKTASMELKQEILRVINPPEPDIISNLRSRPLA